MRSVETGRKTGIAACLIGAVMLAGCDDLLKVNDPGRFISDDLDNPAAWAAVANGPEGRLQQEYSGFVIFNALLGDEYFSTGTWGQYRDIGNGFIQPAGESAQATAWMHIRTEAQEAYDRFERLMGADVSSSVLAGRVRAVEGWTNLLLGMQSCEVVIERAGAVLPYTAAYEAAIPALTHAIQILQAAGSEGARHLNFARAGRARAHLYLGNLNEAAADAQAVSPGFVYDAIYSSQGASNAVVTLTTYVENKAAGMRPMWWAQVDTTGATDVFRDQFTNEVDPRVRIVARHTNRFGVDNITRHYSQFKYQTRTDNIRMTSKQEMRLIEAEVLWRQGDYPGAMTILNALRADAGLSAVANPNTEEGVRDVLLNERFAILFMEGHRATDLDRFDLVTERLGANRARRFALPNAETQNNPSITPPRTCPQMI